MKKDFVVVFKKNGQPRIVKGSEAQKLRDQPNVLVNPELPTDRPIHEWKKSGDIIKPKKKISGEVLMFSAGLIIGGIVGVLLGIVF